MSSSSSKMLTQPTKKYSSRVYILSAPIPCKVRRIKGMWGDFTEYSNPELGCSISFPDYCATLIFKHYFPKKKPRFNVYFTLEAAQAAKKIADHGLQGKSTDYLFHSIFQVVIDPPIARDPSETAIITKGDIVHVRDMIPNNYSFTNCYYGLDPLSQFKVIFQEHFDSYNKKKRSNSAQAKQLNDRLQRASSWLSIYQLLVPEMRRLTAVFFEKGRFFDRTGQFLRSEYTKLISSALRYIMPFNDSPESKEAKTLIVLHGKCDRIDALMEYSEHYDIYYEKERNLQIKACIIMTPAI